MISYCVYLVGKKIEDPIENFITLNTPVLVQRRASSVLRWETAWEPEVLLAYFLLLRQKKEITKCSCSYVRYQHIILLPTLASK